MVWKPIVSVLLVVVLLTPAAVQAYDEAGCKVRSNETYFSGINAICNLPLGAKGMDGSNPPFQMNRCVRQKDTEHNALNTVYGILAAFLACIMFGSMFLPVKKFDTGDGMFFQWMMATGALLVGLVFNLTAWPQPPFFSFAMTGGMLWGVGNILTVPTLKLLGMGMTQTMVGIVNAVGGIISGRFILCQPLKIPLLNTFGVIVVIISAILLSFVGSDGRKKKDGKPPAPIIPVSQVSDYSVNDEKQPLVKNNNTEDSNADQSWVDKLGKIPSRGIGLAMAVTSGFLFGFEFLPVEVLRNCDHDAFPCNELDYVFPQYVGIYLCSTISFAVYCCFKRFNPQVYSKVIIPGIVTGIMYGIGTAMWFLSNKYVGLAVAFPIITSGSGMISSVWGILVFREIKGRFNIIMFLIAFVVVVAGIVMVGLSH